MNETDEQFDGAEPIDPQDEAALQEAIRQDEAELDASAAAAPETDPTAGLETPTDWKPIVEALLFATAEPLTLGALKKLLTGAPAEAIKGALNELRDELDGGGRGITLLEVAGGWMIVTRDLCAPWVEKMLKGKRRVRLSRAALETVAVVAYRQPISRMEVERIRGVDCGGVLATLVERDLVMIKGRDSGPGKPLLYGTTQDFLNYFGLNRLGELPRLDEISTLAARNPSWTENERARFEKAGLEDVPEEIPGFGAAGDGPMADGTGSNGDGEESWVEVANREAVAAGPGATTDAAEGSVLSDTPAPEEPEDAVAGFDGAPDHSAPA